jgi:hypothetical protein
VKEESHEQRQKAMKRHRSKNAKIQEQRQEERQNDRNRVSIAKVERREQR